MMPSRQIMRRFNKTIKWFYGLRTSGFLIAGSLSVTLLLIILFIHNKKKPVAPLDSRKRKWDSFLASVQFHPSVAVINGTDIIWQIPSDPIAVLFLAHGCNGKAANFWDHSQNCPNCVGFPEERLVVLTALSRKFAVLTISSMGRCWSIHKEKKAVQGIIEKWVQENNLHNLPLSALGASSGGYFVSSLAVDMQFTSIVLMIAEGVFDAIDVNADYPPTLFVHMPRDHFRMKLIGENMNLLQRKGVKVAEIQCTEFPLTPNFLSDRIPGLDQEVSVQLFELFRQKGYVDDNGYMKMDGRAVNWKEALKGEDLRSSALEWSNHIQEEMNLAFAFHEMTSLPMEQVMDWIMSMF